MLTPTKIQIHRFRDRVALSFMGVDHDTIYLPAVDALDLCRAAQAVAEEIAAGVNFTQSQVGTVSFKVTTDE